MQQWIHTKPSMSVRASRGVWLLLLMCGAGVCAPELAAQKPPAAPVRYTEARAHALRRALVLPGSVESRVNSVVAAEVEGLVLELAAREGDRVEKGQPLARLRTTPLEIRLEITEAQLKEAESRMKLAERNLERARDLFASKVLSQQQLDEAFFEFNAWQGRVSSLKATAAGIRLDIERCTIRAPFNGAVVRKRTEVGEWIGVGDPVVEMLSLDELEVRVEVPEGYFRLLGLDGAASISFESLPGLEVSGRVSAIIPQADPQARTFPVKVRIGNARGRIGVGMLAQVSFAGRETYRATVVPKDAVIRRGVQQFVYLMNGDNTVSLVPIQTGTAVGAWVSVQEGIQPGQKIITRGNERLQPGQVVQGTPLAYSLP